jgi:hypothetical protein
MIKKISTILLVVFLTFVLSVVVWADRRKEVYKEIDLKGEKSLAVKIEFGAGELYLNGTSSAKLLQADVSYDPGHSDFVCEYDESEEKGELYLGTDLEESEGLYLDDQEDENWWDLKFTGKIPIDFDIDIGAAESELDFTGLKINDLDLNIGAAKGLITFRKPNPERISRISIDAGASKLDIEGLCNANFKRMDFDGGVGDFTLDFSGEIDHRAFVQIDMGLGHLTLLLPKDIGVRVESKDSILSALSITKGEFEEIEEDVWVNDKYGETEGELDIEIDIGLGGVDIELVE